MNKLSNNTKTIIITIAICISSIVFVVGIVIFALSINNYIKNNKKDKKDKDSNEKDNKIIKEQNNETFLHSLRKSFNNVFK